MQLAGLPGSYQALVQGAILLIAAGFGACQKRKRAKETISKAVG
jgi:ABC-type xylose transport system permease subunit